MTKTHPPGVFIVFWLFTFLMTGTSIIQGLLVLYLTTKFSVSDGTAYSIYAAYSASIYVTSLYGGYLGQRFLKHHLAVILGLILCTFGLLILIISLKTILLLGLCCFALGSGLIYPNAYCLLGKLYKHGDAGRDSGFTIAYTGMNLGALIGFLSAGYLQRYISYQAAYLFAAIILFFAIIIFIWKHKIFLSDNNVDKNKKQNTLIGVVGVLIVIPILFALLHVHDFFRWLIIFFGAATFIWLLTYTILYRKTNPLIAKRLLLFFILALFAVVFWALYELQPTMLILFFERNVDRGSLPASGVMAFNPIYMLILGPTLSYLWLYLSKKNTIVPVLSKFSLALIALGLALFMLVIGIHFANSAGYTTLLWIAGFFLLLSIAEMIIAPAGYAAVGMLAPENIQGMMIGIWQLTLGIARAISGQIAQATAVPPVIAQQPLLTNPFYTKDFLYFGLVALIVGLIPFFLMKQFTTTTQH
jgi:proton-dependent oligopeptide transporter, POT family